MTVARDVTVMRFVAWQRHSSRARGETPSATL
jgi:hypothetical protein